MKQVDSSPEERNVEIKLPSCAIIPADGPTEGWIPTNTTLKIELGIAGYLYIVFISFRTRERPGISENEEMLIDCTAQTMDISLSPADGSHSKVANFRQNR